MNDFEQQQLLKGPPPRSLLPGPNRDTPESPPREPTAPGGRGRRLLGLGALLVFICALGLGAWRHYAQNRQVMETAEQQANFVPSLRVGPVVQRFDRLRVTLPATTLGFVEANIFARAVIGGLLFATPTTLLVVPYLFAMLRKGNDGKEAHGVFEEVPE